MIETRRKFLAIIGIVPVVLLTAAKPAKRGPATMPKACADPAALPLSQKNQRRGIGYVEKSTDPQKNCGGCSFFNSGASGCGTCQLLTGGPVDAAGVCTSYAKKD